MSAFRAYDIRGVYPDEVNEELAYNVGRAFVTFLKCKNVAVGYDMRDSAKALFDSLVKGITDQGADVVSIGKVTTPMLNFSVAHYKNDAGIMISASHNPGKYNAFKLVKHPVIQISSDSGMKEIEKLATEGKFEDAEKGKITEKDVLEGYNNHIISKFKGIKKLKVVADYGNGMGAMTATPVLRKLGIEVIELYPEEDPTFPNHPANPHDIENFRDLQNAVKKEKADLGIFFDGDADRSNIVDEKGEIVFPDILFALMMEHELKGHEGEKVYYDLRFSKSARKVIEDNGGVPVMMKVGNPFYKEKLAHEGGLAASEFSGHVMYAENYAIDDGLFAALKVMQILSNSRQSLSEMIKPIIKFHTTPEINIETKGRDPDEIMEKVAGHFKDGESIELDGVYIQYKDWWFSLRKSNTEPLVRLRVEADTGQLMNEKKDEIMKIIEG
jgi:phosphomannomutase